MGRAFSDMYVSIYCIRRTWCFDSTVTAVLSVATLYTGSAPSTGSCPNSTLSNSTSLALQEATPTHALVRFSVNPSPPIFSSAVFNRKSVAIGCVTSNEIKARSSWKPGVNEARGMVVVRYSLNDGFTRNRWPHNCTMLTPVMCEGV